MQYCDWIRVLLFSWSTQYMPDKKLRLKLWQLSSMWCFFPGIFPSNSSIVWKLVLLKLNSRNDISDNLKFYLRETETTSITLYYFYNKPLCVSLFFKKITINWSSNIFFLDTSGLSLVFFVCVHSILKTTGSKDYELFYHVLSGWKPWAERWEASGNREEQETKIFMH